MNPRELPEKWRAEADAYERDGISHAKLLRRVADQLAAAITEWELEALTLEEASDESGYSYAHIQRLVSDGMIQNVGKARSPRVRRGDLPRKTGRAPPLRVQDVDLADEILARRAR